MANLFYNLDFSSESNFTFDPLKVRYVDGVISLLPTLTVYPSDSPYVIYSGTLFAQDIVSISATITNDVSIILTVDGVDTYWSGIAWVASDGTSAQSNSIAEINDNVATLPAFTSVKFKFLLNSLGVNDASISAFRAEYIPVDTEVTTDTKKVFINVRDFNAQVVDLTYNITCSRRNVVQYKDKTIILTTGITGTTVGGYTEIDLVETDNLPNPTFYTFNIGGTRFLKQIPAITVSPVNVLDLPDYVG